MPETLFIADLHLDPRRPEGLAGLGSMLADLSAPDCDGLYILGDLFEAWIGDDEDLPAFCEVQDWLAQCRGRGVPIHLMHGNRDFLLGEAFCGRSGVRLLPDPSVVELDGEPVLLMHGDSLCTDDHAYQALRGQLRDPAWQADFLARPLEERRRMAAALREQSQSETAAKDEAIMDVNSEAVREVMRRHGVRRLIHGHTHRPAVHRFELDGEPAERIVLGDWYEQGSRLRLRGGTYTLESFELG